MIIDFHTHCFPDKIAQRAIAALSAASGGLIPHTDGTAQGLIAFMDKEGVDKSVVLNIATNPHQQHSVNDFAKSIDSETLIAFGSIHPDSPDALCELERIKSLGLKGVKFHPEYQNFFVDDPKMKPIYNKISELGLITVFHAGSDLGYEPPYHCVPTRMVKAMEWFNGSPVVAAHLGGFGYSEDVVKLLCGTDIYLDTAFAYGAVPKKTILRMLEKHGVEKILFATDCPWHNAALEKRMLSTLGLSDGELELIYHGNAEKLLGI